MSRKPSQSLAGRFHIIRVNRCVSPPGWTFEPFDYWEVQYQNVRASTGLPWQSVKHKRFPTEAGARTWAAEVSPGPLARTWGRG
jgi:hypothetical protein